jgi:beta-lactam-binding protein with PASTA domain
MLDEAKAQAAQQGWTLVEAPAVHNAAVVAGRVLDQQPAADTPIRPGAPITITASLGPEAAAPTSAPVAAPPAPPPPAPPAKGGDKGDKGGDKGGKGKGK